MYYRSRCTFTLVRLYCHVHQFSKTWVDSGRRVERTNISCRLNYYIFIPLTCTSAATTAQVDAVVARSTATEKHPTGTSTRESTSPTMHYLNTHTADLVASTFGQCLDTGLASIITLFDFICVITLRDTTFSQKKISLLQFQFKHPLLEYSSVEPGIS
jgi:hypothetical protein